MSVTAEFRYCQSDCALKKILSIEDVFAPCLTTSLAMKNQVLLDPLPCLYLALVLQLTAWQGYRCPHDAFGRLVFRFECNAHCIVSCRVHASATVSTYIFEIFQANPYHCRTDSVIHPVLLRKEPLLVFLQSCQLKVSSSMSAYTVIQNLSKSGCWY